jgi:CRP-like cAMP-binding protein
MNDADPTLPHLSLSGGRRSWPEITDLRIELAEDASEIARVRHPLSARVIELMPGKTDLDLIEIASGSFGLIVLDGLVLVDVTSGRAHVGWLVGDGDLVRPSGLRDIALTQESRWRALTETRLAVLDREFLIRAGSIPIVLQSLVRRAARTSNWLLAKSLIISSPLIQERLLLLLALFAERWGRVTPEGVALKMPLTHANLATICGARRPSVTLALRALEQDELLSCPERGVWLLRRGSGVCSHHPCLADYERSLGLSVRDGRVAAVSPTPLPERHSPGR